MAKNLRFGRRKICPNLVITRQVRNAKVKFYVKTTFYIQINEKHLLVILRFCEVKYDVKPGYYRTRASTIGSYSELQYQV